MRHSKDAEMDIAIGRAFAKCHLRALKSFLDEVQPNECANELRQAGYVQS